MNQWDEEKKNLCGQMCLGPRGCKLREDHMGPGRGVIGPGLSDLPELLWLLCLRLAGLPAALFQSLIRQYSASLVLPHWCSLALPHWCSLALPHWCSLALSHWCSLALPHWCSLALPHWCSLALPHWCSLALPHWCSLALPHWCSLALPHWCSLALPHWCSLALPHCDWCSLALPHWCSLALPHWCSLALPHWCSLALPHWCSLALPHWCSLALPHWVPPLLGLQHTHWPPQKLCFLDPYANFYLINYSSKPQASPSASHTFETPLGGWQIAESVYDGIYEKCLHSTAPPNSPKPHLYKHHYLPVSVSTPPPDYPLPEPDAEGQARAKTHSTHVLPVSNIDTH
ncbi:hypothetical protein ACEWY4_019101 [Coilia grayii]|uniref:Uncharacterized protein n=1 Tax=Coilia grayii TaxID=363190 RepID=A0ABD1JF47_9TELE